jgi:hypothetical protein
MELVGQTLDFLRSRKKAYQLAFKSPAGSEVLQDLAKFCRADQTCFDADPRIHAVLEGRREVWLRIQQHLNLTSDQLYAIFTGRGLPPEQ